MNTLSERAERILDCALALGERSGWDALHLHEVARELGIALGDVHACYSNKDALAEAWFDRADRAMLEVASTPGWAALEPRERLRRAIIGWLDALAEHRALTGEMLRYKFQPEHIHLQALGAARVSRTVQWIRETAALPAHGLRREIEEAALTTLYLATFACWLTDETPGTQRTRSLLGNLLAGAERGAAVLDRILPTG